MTWCPPAPAPFAGHEWLCQLMVIPPGTSALPRGHFSGNHAGLCRAKTRFRVCELGFVGVVQPCGGSR
jgi:hypothetical protein